MLINQNSTVQYDGIYTVVGWCNIRYTVRIICTHVKKFKSCGKYFTIVSSQNREIRTNLKGS